MTVPIREYLAPLRHRGYRLVFSANVVSAVGNQVVPVALAFAVLDATGSATVLGVVLLARTLSLALFVLIGGVWADRLPRQLVMVGADLIRFVSQGAFAVLLLTGHAPVSTMVVLQGMHGAATAFFRPASGGLLAQVLPPDLRQRGTAMFYAVVRS